MGLGQVPFSDRGYQMKTLIEEPFQFNNGLLARNRVVMAPITLSVCLPGGYVSSEDVAYYQRRSSAVGLAITGSAYVDPQGLAFADSFSAAEDDKIEGLSRIAKAMKSEGALAVLQLYHGGRMVPPDLISGCPIGPSPIKALHGDVVQPRPLKNKEVDHVIDSFLAAIERAIAAGFDGVELHGANTYLIQQFLSPHSNQRRDKWGGTVNNRLRFAKTLVKKAKKLANVKANRPFLIGYRLSPEEIEEPGITLNDSLQLIEQLIQLDIDYLHLSLATVWQKSLRNPNQTDPLIYAIRDKIDQRVPLIAVGQIQTQADAQKVLDAGIPLFSIGQALLLDPEWTSKIVQGKESELVHHYRDDLKEYTALPEAFITNFREFLKGN